MGSTLGGGLAVYEKPYGNTYRRAALAGGASIEQEYDAPGRMIARSFSAAGGALHGWSLAYTADGNLASRTRLQDGRQESFGYDDFDRLVHWEREGSGLLPARTVSWVWDGRDNLQSMSDSAHGAVATSVNLLDQLLTALPEIPGISYRPSGEEHDRDFSGGGERTIRWDALGRPLEGTLDQGGGPPLTVEWLHDGLDRLVGRVSSEGDATWSWYVGPHLLASSSSEWGEVELVHGHGFDEILWRQRNGAEELYAFTGPFGDLEAWLTPTSVVEAYDYDPFGQPRDPVTGSVVTASAIGNTLFFLSKPFDAELGVSHLGRRLYDPVHGRFLSRDPLGELESPNLYSYPGQNPFRWKDPTGLQGESQTVLPRILPNVPEQPQEESRAEPQGGPVWPGTWDEKGRRHGGGDGLWQLTILRQALAMQRFIETGGLLDLHTRVLRQDPELLGPTNPLRPPRPAPPPTVAEPMSPTSPGGGGGPPPDGFTARDAASLGVGLIPGVGSVQSAVELITGRDYVSGRRTSRGLAFVGLFAGLLPFGKFVVSGGSKAAKLARGAANLADDAARGASGVGDALKGLRAGSSSRVRLVDSADELEGVFGRLSAGGKPLEGTTYPGRLMQLPDGTRVGIRPMSSSGGPTIDIHPPSGPGWKVHVGGGS